jgi:hypothetical protein
MYASNLALYNNRHNIVNSTRTQNKQQLVSRNVAAVRQPSLQTRHTPLASSDACIFNVTII